MVTFGGGAIYRYREDEGEEMEWKTKGDRRNPMSGSRK